MPTARPPSHLTDGPFVVRTHCLRDPVSGHCWIMLDLSATIESIETCCRSYDDGKKLGKKNEQFSNRCPPSRSHKVGTLEAPAWWKKRKEIGKLFQTIGFVGSSSGQNPYLAFFSPDISQSTAEWPWNGHESDSARELNCSR